MHTSKQMNGRPPFEGKSDDSYSSKPQLRAASAPVITAESLGSSAFRSDYRIKYAYLSGAMYRAIASPELVVAMGRGGLLGYLGTGGLALDEIEAGIRYIQAQLTGGESFGVNLLANMDCPEVEERTVDIYLRYGIRHVEAASYMQITPSVARYRLKGLARNGAGAIETHHHIVAKVSRPEVAAAFMRPVPKEIVAQLLSAGLITATEAELAPEVPVASDICVEADSGGHTDGGVAYALMPAMFRMRDDMMAAHNYRKRIRVGAAGGIGTPEAAAASFVMGADFILTGSINQCSVEAGTSDAVKDILQGLDIQDTTYAPAGDLFELGAKVQVVRKGVFFPSRANKLYELYQRFESIAEIDEKTQRQIQEKYFHKSFQDVWEETRQYYARAAPKRIAEVERNPKQKMALIFKWYFWRSSRLALEGAVDDKVNYQIACGPALGAFNQWVKGSHLESWRNRRVADIGERIMLGAADLLNRRMAEFAGRESGR